MDEIIKGILDNVWNSADSRIEKMQSIKTVGEKARATAHFAFGMVEALEQINKENGLGLDMSIEVPHWISLNIHEL